MESKKSNDLKWYVMRCRKTDAIVDKIEAYFNSDTAPADKLESYFIPFVKFDCGKSSQSPKGREPSAEDRAMTDAVVRAKGFRSALRQFVFLLIRPSGLYALLYQHWNVKGTRLLYHYRDFNGKKVTVPPHMMKRFMDACAEYGDKLEICTVQPEIEKGLSVKVREGAFAGLDAEVVSISYKASGMRFTIAVKLFGQGNFAYVHNLTSDDVIVDSQDSYAFTADFIDRLEDNILAILKWHIKKKETNKELLEEYFQMRHVVIKGIDLAVRFDTLMLYCAVLLRKTAAKTKYIKLLKSRIKEISASNLSDQKKARCQAYILSGLFLSTKDADYRDRLKRIVKEQLPQEDILRRHVAVLRDL